MRKTSGYIIRSFSFHQSTFLYRTSKRKREEEESDPVDQDQDEEENDGLTMVDVPKG
jgi:hypothetical protein